MLGKWFHPSLIAMISMHRYRKLLNTFFHPLNIFCITVLFKLFYFTPLFETFSKLTILVFMAIHAHESRSLGNAPILETSFRRRESGTHKFALCNLYIINGESRQQWAETIYFVLWIIFWISVTFYIYLLFFDLFLILFGIHLFFAHLQWTH